VAPGVPQNPPIRGEPRCGDPGRAAASRKPFCHRARRAGGRARLTHRSPRAACARHAAPPGDLRHAFDV